MPDCFMAYYKLFIFEYHRQSTLLKRNVLGDMTCTLTTQSKSEMTFCAKANPFNSQDLIVNSPI